MATPSSGVTLRPATDSDVDTLASIADAAFATDTHTQLKAAFHGESSFKDGMRQGLEGWLQSPKVDLIVAEVDGKPVGWIGWARRGFAGDVDQPLSGPEEEPLAAAEELRTIKNLEELTNASMEYWVCRLMPPGCRCRIVVSCVVHPEYQGRGVGSRLLRWGTEKADSEEGVFCWVQSSMGAVAAYKKLGFREVGRLKANLDEYAEGKEPGETWEHVTGSRTSWGTYSWVYMRREAKA
ncbi:GNAT family [Colletotrichum plurivorum]|uniref:GNAT family n=1 Tax=Colletotrichum plurivorum TaxID=2175906 RepID=A0A8H6K831_9PEZI|nr:GNAT family [Colletotrichum plurivorum]